MLKAVFTTAILIGLASTASAHVWTETHTVGASQVAFFQGRTAPFDQGVQCTVAPGGNNPDLPVQFWIGGITPLVPYTAYPGMVVGLGYRPQFQVSTVPDSSGSWDQTAVVVSCRAEYQ